MDNNKKSLLGNEKSNLSFQVEILSTLDDIKISKQNDLLILENSFIRRVIDLSQGLPRTISLQNRQGIELAAKDNIAFDIGFIGLIDTENSNDQWQLKSITCVKKKHDIFETKRLIVEISCENISSQINCTKTYILYPNLGVIGVESSIQTKVMPNFFWSHRKRIPQIQCVESVGDSFKLASTIVPVLSVEFKGRTDEEAVPVLTHLVTEDTMIGNLLYCENNSQLGLMFLQEAPPSMEKRDYEEYDFRYDSKTNVIRSCTWGVAPEDIKVGRQIYKSYRHVLLVYQNEEEKKSILKRYLALRYDVSPFYSVTVNPWGCGRFPLLVSSDFLKAEVQAASQIGATCYQFDDGWQQGEGLAKMTRDNCYIRPEFWEFRKSIGESFPEIIKYCKKLKLQSALWFAPSENVEYKDWKSSVKILWDIYQEFGIRCFKIDAVRLRTLEAERNLKLLLTTLRKKSNGEIFFNLDVTAGQRFGYFQFLEFGNIFLENRYLFTYKNNSYHPEKTLRSLWLLARYTRPQYLQIEIPNPDDYLARATKENMVEKPSSCLYPLEYWAAIALFANPLLWFAPSLVSSNNRKIYKKMVKLHLSIRDEVFSGEIYPIGQEPTGKSISGLLSTSGLVICYREIAALNDTLFIPELAGNTWELIAGVGKVVNGNLTMPKQASFALFKKIN